MPSRPFEPQWTTDAPALKAFLDTLCTDLTAARAKPHKADAKPRFEAAIKAIVLDLFRAHESVDQHKDVALFNDCMAVVEYPCTSYVAGRFACMTAGAMLDGPTRSC
ncbi:hypothetical protein KBY28_07985 [Ruegeria pomeroyi]|uniref:hypothetical protein n=1 Tax=Ruegeria pomeroyi TaxID=89184 RepID=UPI001F1917E4|nr:hypothetical protein [Ruegeria pomeroyi]MCE8508389.1 hypothetical protein [Ruegeria pomeroyi]